MEPTHVASRHYHPCMLQRSGLARPLLAFWALQYLLPVLCLLFVTNPLHSAEYEFVKPIINRVNQTGRVITLPLPLKDGETLLGDVIARVNPDDSVLINLADLKQRLQSTLNGGSKRALEQMASPGGFVTIENVKAAGINLTFDKGLQELQLAVATDLRLTSEISVGGRSAVPVSSVLSQPANVSGYLNISSGIDYVWARDTPGGAPSQLSGLGQRMGFEAVARLYGIVTEHRFLYEGDIDANVCPTGARCVYQHEPGFKRQSSRVVYDMPQSQLRVSVGDTEPLAAPVQRSVEMLGISIEKSPYQLAPGTVSGATARTQLRLDRPSEVDVIVNGVVVQHLRLRPGTYNIRDLPLATGANDIKLSIVDDTGAQRAETFSTFGAGNLLPAGLSEWAVTAGVPSYLRDNERAYVAGESMASLYGRYGLSDFVTGEANAQADSRVAMATIGAKTSTPWGALGVYGGGSTGDLGQGLAGGFNWDVLGYTGMVAERAENFSLAAEYRGKGFRRPGDLYTTASGILFPEFNYWLYVSANYSTKLDDNIGLALSARYQFADDKQPTFSPFTIKGDRYGADVTLSRALGTNVLGSLLVGYSNESYLRLSPDIAETAKPDLRVGVRLSFRPEDATSVTTGYDSLNRQSTVSAYRAEGNGIGRWDTSLNVQNLGYADTTNASGSLGYYGNRGEVTLSHFTDATGTLFDPKRGADVTQRTSLRVGASVAFADGVVAVGPPIRGGAFAIVHPHDSIASKDVIVGDTDTVRAKADLFGPGVVTDVPAYWPTSIPIDVADLPLGYSLGAGAFDLRASYRAGYLLEVGSAYSVSVVGLLVDADGGPIALSSGTARSVENPAKMIAVFTNGAGKFGAEGMAPGRWIIEMATDTPLSFSLVIPKDAQGLIKAGTLKPTGDNVR